MKVEAMHWCRRYFDGQAVRHKESGTLGIVREFEHQGFYVGDRYVVIPTYLVYFGESCWVHTERCQHYVAEDELEAWVYQPTVA